MVKVSVICLTYNQEKFIRRALDGFVMQKTNFPFEVIVHDDASTDKTPEILREYQAKYPDIIKPVFEEKNTFSQGINLIFTKEFLSLIHGEYVAVCEGDDYWTDENKLQIQADFLDAHPDFSVCFHPVKVEWENGKEKPTIFPSSKWRFHKTVLGLEDLLKRNFIQTNSVMYRWCFTPEMNPGAILPGDWYWHLLHAQRGKIGFIDKVMGVYYRNAGGIWSNGGTDDFYIRNGLPHIRFYEAVEKQFFADKTEEKTGLCRQTAEAALRHGNTAIIKELQEQHPDLLKQAFKNRESGQIKRMCRRIKRLRLAVYLLAVAFISTLVGAFLQ